MRDPDCEIFGWRFAVGAETPVRVFGLNLTNFAEPIFNGRVGSRIFDIQVVSDPLIGDIVSAFAIVSLGAPATTGSVSLQEGGASTVLLPFTVK